MKSHVNAEPPIYRVTKWSLQLFFAHENSLSQNKEEGYMSIPTAELSAGDALLDTVIRKFEEKTGNKFRSFGRKLESIIQKDGRKAHCRAFGGTHDSSRTIQNDLFKIRWASKSDRIQIHPEATPTKFFSRADASVKLKNGPWSLEERLNSTLNSKNKNGQQS